MAGTVRFANGVTVPALGQGTWELAEARGRRAEEIATLRAGIDLGLTLIDTAEMYGEGAAEDLIGEAIAGRRDAVFLVSKVYPHNASRAGVRAACERSLKRLGTDRIDLYLLHWPGNRPLGETVAGFEDLIAAGKIRQWGVSNFDMDEMQALMRIAGGAACACNQILYNLAQRGPEFDLLPWMERLGMPAMAYSPLDRGDLANGDILKVVARRHGATVAQVALAFVLSRPNVIAIPKASTLAHVQANARAAAIRLSAEDQALLNTAFPAPRRKTRLAVY